MTKYQITKQEQRVIVLKKSGEYVVELVGEGAEVVVVGRFVSGITKYELRSTKKDVVVCEGNCEVKITVIHRTGNTRAETVLKGVGYGASKMKLDGKIVVEKGCPGVNSFLTERVLLVGEKARGETVPDLEIESDDVKCSHAATISRIPEEQVFYLMARGLRRAQAKEMVVEGFLGD